MARWLRIMKCHRRAIVSTMVAIIFSLICPTAASSETLQTYRTGIDVGNDPSTGCDFSLGTIPPGTLPGFELQITVVVDTDLESAQVVSAQVETCNGVAFADPQPLSGFTRHTNSLEGALPRSLFGDAMSIRLAHHARSFEGCEDALFTFDGRPGGAAITVGFPSYIPALSPLGLGLLVLLLLGVVLMKLRRGSWAATLVLLVVGSGSVIAYAAFNEILAVDDPADATPADRRVEIVSSFAKGTPDELVLRLDIAKLDIEGYLFKSSAADKFVIADAYSGILSATAPDADSDFSRIVLEYNSDEHNFFLRLDVTDRYLTVHPPDSFVFADATDAGSAAGWLVYVLAADDPLAVYEYTADAPAVYEYEVVIVEDIGGLQALRFDSSTNNLHVNAYGSVNELLDDPATLFYLYIGY